jgi:hypothetical protein
MSLDLISRAEAIDLLGSEWGFDELRKSGRLGPARHDTSYGGRPRPWFKRAAVQRLVQERARPGPDWLTVREAMAEFHFTKKTLYGWVNDDCLALARPIKPLKHRGVLYLPRADLVRCRALLREPLEGVACPGNTGMWTSPEVYKDETGALWVTPAYALEHYRIGNRRVHYWLGHPKQAAGKSHVPGGLPLRHEDVRRPGRCGRGGETVLVVRLDDIKAIVAWQQGNGSGSKGHWRPDGLYEADGRLWATNTWLQKRANASEMFASYWHKRGKLTRLPAWKVRRGKGGRGSVWVYAVDEARKLIDRRGADATVNWPNFPAAAPPASAGQRDPAIAAPSGEGASGPTKQPRARGGRPKGSTDPKVREREERMRAAAQSGDFANATELARAFEVDPSYARKVVRGLIGAGK